MAILQQRWCEGRPGFAREDNLGGCPYVGRHLAAAASNRFRNSSFFSAGRNEASKELRASSRRCSSVNPKVCWASWYSRARVVPNNLGAIGTFVAAVVLIGL